MQYLFFQPTFCLIPEFYVKLLLPQTLFSLSIHSPRTGDFQGPYGYIFGRVGVKDLRLNNETEAKI